LGFISVLPGAFSGYRYRAIREQSGKGPLVEYFKSITTPMSELGAFKANMYLAEDRILCFELVARKGCAWKLEYVKNAVAVTDVPDKLTDLIGQRRRWLNGSLFAMLYAVLNFGRFINESTHSMFFKMWVTIEFAYQCITLVLNWFLCANFFLAFYFLIKSDNLGCFGDAGSNHIVGSLCIGEWQGFIGNLMVVVYMCLIVAQVLVALGNKPTEMPMLYSFSAWFFGAYTFFTAVLSLQFIFSYDQQICFSTPAQFSYPGPTCLDVAGAIQGSHGSLRNPSDSGSGTGGQPWEIGKPCYVEYKFSGGKRRANFKDATCPQLNSMFGNKPYDLLIGESGWDHTSADTPKDLPSSDKVY
jgi:hypothetical protein